MALSPVTLSEGAKAAGALAIAFVVLQNIAFASMPSIDQLDADARAAGNLKPLAVRIGERLFATAWPAQVTQVSANGVDGHLVVGVRILGVRFHRSLSRTGFEIEVDRLVALAFAFSPQIEEVDVWASVPIVVGKDVIVSGDLAVPTWRPVFTVAVRRGIAPSLSRAFWDEEWARAAFKQDW